LTGRRRPFYIPPAKKPDRGIARWHYRSAARFDRLRQSAFEIYSYGADDV
jgi:hypothetical protein